MSDAHEIIHDIAVLLAVVAAGFSLGFIVSNETTSDWWKAEIIRRGYGAWETTPDGQVWFKWKEERK